MAQPKLALIRIKTTLIPLPPLAEQKRIVERVDALLAQTRELESRLSQAETTLTALHQTAVNTLLSATDPDDFAVRWQFIAENFNLLYDETYPETAVANIAQLKQAILQLAVQGKLTHQEPQDEPASALLQRIAAEKVRLGIKSKELAEVGEEERPFVLPDGWEWVRVGNIIEGLRYGTSKKCTYEPDGVPVLRIPNIDNGGISTEDLKYTQLTEKEIENLYLKPDDLLLIRSNGSVNLVGRSAIVGNQAEGFAYAGYLVRVRLIDQSIFPKYLHLVFETKLIRQQIELPIRTTTGVKNINSQEISDLSLPFPPLAEQKRIVTRVNALLRLCDELSAQLQEAQATRAALRDAVLGS